MLSHLFHEMRCCILWNVEFNLKFCCVLADERCLFSSTCINNFHESLEQLIFLLLDRYLLKCSCKDTWLNCLTVTTGSYTNKQWCQNTWLLKHITPVCETEEERIKFNIHFTFTNRNVPWHCEVKQWRFWHPFLCASCKTLKGEPLHAGSKMSYLCAKSQQEFMTVFHDCL